GELRRGARLAPRVLERTAAGVLRAALVPTQAGPLAGDRDRVRLVVRAGAALAIEPVAATLALPGAERIVLELEVIVEPGGRLVLDEGPLIVAGGASVRRRCRIELADGAVAALRETVVLGRDGEPPGALDAATRVELDGRALLHDGLRIDPARAEGHVALAPGDRVVATVALLGTRPDAPHDGYDLALPGALLRRAGPALAALEPQLAATWSAWAQAALASGADRG
ncbi:MAG: urease accessory protein UreD, partial [Vicinamibacteria bacterium]